MARHIIFSLGIVCIIAVCLIEAVREPRKKGKKPKVPKVKDNIKRDVQDLQTELALVRKLINEGVHDDAIGQCGTNKVHFFFHDHDHDHHEHEEDDVHVHVDLHLNKEGGHTPFGDSDHHDHVHTAVCQFDKGHAYISQNVKDRYASFKFSFSEITVETFAIHVHQNGDLRNGCSGLGGHYDPIDADIDVGNIGTITPATDDIKEVLFQETKLSLIGAHSIIGRSIVGHDTDGKRLTCCVIGRASDDHDHDAHPGHEGHTLHGHDPDSHEGHSHVSHADHGHKSHEGHDHDGHEGHDHDGPRIEHFKHSG